MPKPNWSSGASGAMQGASAGSAGGWIGAVVGGIAGLLTGLYSGGGTKKEKLKKVPTGTPEQEKLGSQFLDWVTKMGQEGGGYQGAQNYYNQFLGPDQQTAYQQFAAPYMQEYQEQTLPNIAERFAGAGALSSSGFGQALGGSSSNLQSNLAKVFTDLQQQAAAQNYNQYLNSTQLGLNYEPFAYYQKPGGATQGGGFMEGFDPTKLAGLFGSSSGDAGNAGGAGGGLMKTGGMLGGGGGGQYAGGSHFPSLGNYPQYVNTSGKYNLPTFLGK